MMSDEAQFQIMRFQIMAFAMSEIGSYKIPDHYLYAWDEKIYPAFDGAVEWHLPFKDFFSVSEEEVTELTVFLDKLWLEDKVPNFYEIEDHYDVRRGTTTWDRHKLIVICRYMYLKGSFDEKFWNKIVEPMRHPSEAGFIVSAMDRDRSTYFL